MGGQVGAIVPTGTFTYNFYKTASCTGSPFSSQSGLSLNSESATQSNLGAGDYSFRASYSGDTNYNGSTGVCEQVTVGKADTTTVTEIHKEGDTTHTSITSINLGDAVHDKALVSTQVGSFTIGGTVSYVFFTSGNCTTGGGVPQVVAVGSESGASGALAAGSYSYQATYSGDANYNGSIGACEPLTVNKATLGATTELHKADESVVAVSTSVPLGTTMHDKATVTGIVTGFAPANVTFTFFANGTCEGTGTASGSVAPDVSGVAHPSTAQGPLAAGSYAFRASIATTSNYTGTTSACEPFTVNKAQLTTSTQVHDASDAAITNGSVPLASIVHDTATVSGGVGGFATPGVSFTFYTNSGCTGNGTAVANNGTEGPSIRSANSNALGAGNYAYKAVVAGNENYLGNNSDCEPFTVNKANLTMTTDIHDASEAIVTSVPLGSTVHDRANVTGIASGFAPTDNVSFRFYENGICDGAGSAAGAVAIVAGVAHPSDSRGPLAAGSYSFQASYPGDDNYNAKTAACEPLTVNKANSSTATDIHDGQHGVVTTVALGSTVHDKAIVSGTGFGTPTGTVDFTFFGNGTCTGNGAASGTDIALSGGVADPSASQGPLAAGSYSFKAHYDGDTNYNSSDGPCEPLTVNKAQLSVATLVHDTNHTDKTNQTVPLGSVMHDVATVSGGVNDFALPAVSFTMTTNYTDSCASGTVVANNGTEGTGTKSADSAALGAGSYAYRAVVAGNDNYIGVIGACEPFAVNKADLDISTVVHNDAGDVALVGNLPLGGGAHDSASVTGQVGSIALPSVTFYFFPKGVACQNGDTTGATQLNTIAPNGAGIAHPSTSQTNLAAGSYNFMAVVAGNVNYNGKTGACEPFTVNKAQLSIATNVHNAAHQDKTNSTVPLGSVMHDVATVSGNVGSFPVPAVSFTLTGNFDQACDAGQAVATSGDESGNPRSADSAALAAGSYAYRAVVAGDDNYIGATGICEPFTVNKAQLTTTTQVHNAAHTNITGNSVALGSVVHDTASVTGGVSGFPVPSVSFSLYNTLNCSGNSSAVANNGSEGGSTKSADSAALGAGSYAYKAVVAGNDNYIGNDSDCEPFTVNKANLQLTTDIHNGTNHATPVTSVPLGSTVHDQANVGGQTAGFDPTGSISFVFYTASNTCEGSSLASGTVALTGSVAHPSDPQGPLGAGSYSFRASYPGDSNYNAATADCEPLTVQKATPTLSTTLHNSDETVIGTEAKTDTVHDQANIGGAADGFPLTGNVNFTFFTNGTCANTGSAAGSVAINNGVAHPSNSQGPLAAGSYSFRASYPGTANYNTVTSDCEPFTVTKLTINKLANGGSATFGYTVTGPTSGTPNITTSGTPSTGSVTLVVFAGQYTVGETTIPATWQLVSQSCAGSNPSTNPTSAPFNIPAGTNGVCNFENTKNGATRTQGFWSTHTVFTNQVWTTLVPADERDLRTWGPGCTGAGSIIDATATPLGQNELMGGFWANVANTSNKDKRSAIDKNRMQMLQQLLAAMLNRWGIGTNDGGLIDAAQAAFCSGNQNAIQQKIGQLDSFNQSGDSVPLNFNVPNATPKASKDQANIPYWDNPTTH